MNFPSSAFRQRPPPSTGSAPPSVHSLLLRTSYLYGHRRSASCLRSLHTTTKDHEPVSHQHHQGRTRRMQATARRLSVVSATSCARRRLIRVVRRFLAPLVTNANQVTRNFIRIVQPTLQWLISPTESHRTQRYDSTSIGRVSTATFATGSLRHFSSSIPSAGGHSLLGNQRHKTRLHSPSRPQRRVLLSPSAPMDTFTIGAVHPLQLNEPETPNHALQRTGSAVTAPAADHRRLSTHRQVPRPLRLSPDPSRSANSTRCP
ncbi:MAG: hypothetical protein CJBNEKGG_03394 [Prosthecobacter sp.]|nr:hypothetical protein [Prosthecobacter sp.]